MQEMIRRHAQPGRLEAILLRTARRAEMSTVASVSTGPRGLEGDHGSSEKRAVTLIQAEHLAVIGSMLGTGPVAASVLRRNLVVSGLNLAALRGRRLRIGGAELEMTGICAPCSRMEEAFGPGGYSAVRGLGGMCARVLTPGRLTVGDSVAPLQDSGH
ncbi:MOSC domain-containing protein [uncultured Roseobacter sp.]|uniref:MOSC domain-containing protein n=1 Tax=uncultured Roseobacter sp. TaxID=114847 RepID=UPI002609C98B|nr:MOSC domain-containing protein [uncultured Roseobacter sp.]